MSIVVGYLDSPEGREALRAATAEAQSRSTDLVVVVSERTARMSADDISARDAALGVVRGELTAAGVPFQVSIQGETGDPADDLVSVATELGAAMIVIGLRRRSPVGKLILGSNAQRILLDAPCPVLAVKPERA